MILTIDEYSKKLADILINYSVNIKKDDKVLITGDIEIKDFIYILYYKIIKKGAFVEINFRDDNLAYIFLNEANEKQLNFVSDIKKLESQYYDVYIKILGSKNTRTFTNIKPDKFTLWSKANIPLTLNLLQRASEGKARWVATTYPVNSLAQDANMSLYEYKEFVFKAAKLDKKDPIKAWQDLAKKQDKIINFLKDKEIIKVEGENINLKLKVKGRKWINDCGHENFPAGEIFTSPIEDSIEGEIEFSYPGFYLGQEVKGIYLKFKQGKVIEYKSKSNYEFLDKMLNIDENAKKVGEFAIGTNYSIKQFTRNVLFDEKIGGTMHLALGASIPETGGKNKSSIHWDIVTSLKNAKMYADDILFYKNQKFII